LKILVIRPDRIGDLVLSTSVLRAIKTKYEDAFVALLASEYAGEIVSTDDNIDKLYLLKNDNSNIDEILDEVKAENFTHSITLQVDDNASWIPVKAKIKTRVGPYSKLGSLRMFNRGIIQKRSKSIQNEAQYNLDLLSKIDINYEALSIEDIRPKLSFKEKKIKGVTGADYIVMHPGMGQSALNLLPSTYVELAKKLAEKNELYITFGPQDDEMYETFSKDFDKSKLLKGLSLSDLKTIYAKAHLFIGPSTGPMHIAAALGTKVFAIFSPVKVQSSNRWAPWGNRYQIHTPEVTCKEKYNCNENCEFFNCVHNISADTLFEEINTFLSEL
jgi:ADP-heptose:LPS heptosyltransferase